VDVRDAGRQAGAVPGRSDRVIVSSRIHKRRVRDPGINHEHRDAQSALPP
jgi:hypothetical protein